MWIFFFQQLFNLTSILFQQTQKRQKGGDGRIFRKSITKLKMCKSKSFKSIPTRAVVHKIRWMVKSERYIGKKTSYIFIRKLCKLEKLEIFDGNMLWDKTLLRYTYSNLGLNFSCFPIKFFPFVLINLFRTVIKGSLHREITSTYSHSWL